MQQLEHQIHTIKQHFRLYTIISLSPTKHALDQLIKGCYLVMHNAVLLVDENTALHTANQKQHQKHSKPVSSILQGGILTIQDGQLHTQNSGGEVVGQSINKPKPQASSKRSLCSSYEHTACTCAQRYSNN